MKFSNLVLFTTTTDYFPKYFSEWCDEQGLITLWYGPDFVDELFSVAAGQNMKHPSGDIVVAWDRKPSEELVTTAGTLLDDSFLEGCTEEDFESLCLEILNMSADKIAGES